MDHNHDPIQDALETLMRLASPDKLKLERVDPDSWKVSFALHIGTVTAHQMMNVLEELDSAELELPNFAKAPKSRMGFGGNDT